MKPEHLRVEIIALDISRKLGAMFEEGRDTAEYMMGYAKAAIMGGIIVACKSAGVDSDKAQQLVEHCLETVRQFVAKHASADGEPSSELDDLANELLDNVKKPHTKGPLDGKLTDDDFDKLFGNN